MRAYVPAYTAIHNGRVEIHPSTQATSAPPVLFEEKGPQYKAYRAEGDKSDLDPRSPNPISPRPARAQFMAACDLNRTLRGRSSCGLIVRPKRGSCRIWPVDLFASLPIVDIMAQPVGCICRHNVSHSARNRVKSFLPSACRAPDYVPIKPWRVQKLHPGCDHRPYTVC